MGTAYTDTGVEIVNNPVFDYLLLVGTTVTSSGYEAGVAVYIDELGAVGWSR